MIKKVWKMFFSYFTTVNVFAPRNRSVFEEWPSQPFPFLKQLLKLVWDLLFHEELTYVPILAKLDCIHKYESEGKINTMVRKVIKVDYEPNKLWEPVVSQMKVHQSHWSFTAQKPSVLGFGNEW